MPIPDFQTLMLPLLRLAADGQERSLRNAYDALADQFRLTPEERREMLPSGVAIKFNNRVAWARTYMKQAGLLEYPRRGHFRITGRGREVLQSGVSQIDIGYLQQFDEFRDFKSRKKADDTAPVDSTTSEALEETPEEQLEAAHQTLRAGLATEVLSAIQNCSPEFF
ncbi:MAG: winged helix-turn-helix domain-containing protein, partial [Pseudomonadales bacterium]